MVSMLSLKEVSQKNKGFTLIEFVLGMSLVSIVLCSVFVVLNHSMNIFQYGDESDEILLNGRYAIDYIKNEIMSADKIISSSKFKNLDFEYPTNIGFVIMSKGDIRCNYITYYKRNDELTRISCEGLENRYPNSTRFSGFNQVCTLLLDFNKTELKVENNLMEINLKLGYDNGNTVDFKSTIFIRCPIDY